MIVSLVSETQQTLVETVDPSKKNKCRTKNSEPNKT